MTKFYYTLTQGEHSQSGPIEADSIEQVRERLEHNFPDAEITITEA